LIVERPLLMARTRPSVFVGSSKEGLKIAKALQILLDHACEVTIWSQGVFGLSQGSLESLVRALDEFDFAVLILTADDLVISREESSAAPRDNVLFELGLFMGGLGKDRTFIVYDRSKDLKLPSDLAGVSAATFEPHVNGNFEAALGAAATRVENQVTRLGLRVRESLKQLSEAAHGFDTAAVQMHKLVELIARSRKVELGIIGSPLFATFLSPEELKQIEQDHADLEATLRHDSDRTRTQ
jgi:Predicted nucleotide-binding protein containing TIR-like domain